MTERGASPEDDALRERIAAGRRAWPGLALEDEAFAAHLLHRRHEGALPPVEHCPDLWLACACALGVAGAARELSRVHAGAIERAVSRVAQWDAEDSAQHVLTALLVGADGAPPRIAEYAGRAPLASWLRTVATRTALNRQRRLDTRPHDSVSALTDAAARGDVDLQLLRARCAPMLDGALRAALATLGSRDRMILRLHEVDHWSIDRIAALYRVGRSSAARWVNAARQALLEATRARLREQLAVTPTELESLLRDLQSDVMAVSIVRLLAELEGEPPR